MMLPRGQKEKAAFSASIKGLARGFEELTEAVFQKMDMREILLREGFFNGFLSFADKRRDQNCTLLRS